MKPLMFFNNYSSNINFELLRKLADSISIDDCAGGKCYVDPVDNIIINDKSEAFDFKYNPSSYNYTILDRIQFGYPSEEPFLLNGGTTCREIFCSRFREDINQYYNTQKYGSIFIAGIPTHDFEDIRKLFKFIMVGYILATFKNTHRRGYIDIYQKLSALYNELIKPSKSFTNDIDLDSLDDRYFSYSSNNYGLGYSPLISLFNFYISPEKFGKVNIALKIDLPADDNSRKFLGVLMSLFVYILRNLRLDINEVFKSNLGDSYYRSFMKAFSSYPMLFFSMFDAINPKYVNGPGSFIRTIYDLSNNKPFLKYFTTSKSISYDRNTKIIYSTYITPKLTRAIKAFLESQDLISNSVRNLIG